MMTQLTMTQRHKPTISTGYDARDGEGPGGVAGSSFFVPMDRFVAK